MTTGETSPAAAAAGPGWRVFLRPGWIALAITVVVFAVLCFRVFAPWQLGKHSRTEHRNDRVSAALSAPPAQLDELLKAGVGPTSEWRSVVVTGTYDSEAQLLLRHRTVNGNAQGPQILTPLRFDGGEMILVDRGYLPLGTVAVPPAPTGEVTLKARLRLTERTPAGRPAITVTDGARQLEAIDPAVAGPLVGAALANAYLQLVAGQPGSLGALEEPNLDTGPYLSYGLQWLAFGVIAILALGYFGYAELRPAQGGAPPSPARPGEPRPSAPQAARPSRAERRKQLRAALAGEDAATPEERPLADRYGR